MKKLICALIALLLVVSVMLTSCGNNAADPSAETKAEETTGADATSAEPSDTAEEATTADETEAEVTTEEVTTAEVTTEETTTEEVTTEAVEEGPYAGLAKLEEATDVSYVLIYNPKGYSEEQKTTYIDLNPSSSTGSFGSQIDPTMKRGEELKEDDIKMLTIAQTNPFEGIDMSAIDLSGNRADIMITPYKVGDSHDFYCGSGSRSKATFNCVYAGSKCNIWTNEDLSSYNDAIDRLGNKFDNEIYDADVSLFGSARFADNGGKVNLLVYDFGYNSRYIAGFCTIFDMFSSGECSTYEAVAYGLNLDHTIVHINALYLGVPEFEQSVYSTAAHEFQHQICFTSYFENGGNYLCGTWLNEAMSGFIEEYLFSGIQEEDGRYDNLGGSQLIRRGQSMYDFTTSNTDIGVYGSVFLFSEYLYDLGGTDAFSNIHKQLRRATKTATDAKLLYKSFSSDVIEKIDGVISYPAGFLSLSKEDEWLSKLILSFYITLLEDTEKTPEVIKKLDAMTLLYDEINPTDVFGGGRVIVATKDGTYKVPSDAEKGLVYIGLNENFEIITQPLFK